MKEITDMSKQVRKGERFPNWNNFYKENKVNTMPWFHPELDADLKKALRKMKISSGSFLDIGTGPGTQAEQLCKMGFTVTGIDLSDAAIEGAKNRFKDMPIKFLVDDVIHSHLAGPFDFAFDRGCFHVLPPTERQVYVETLDRLLVRKGILFLKCFSSEETNVEGGPWRFQKQDIIDIFEKRFEIKGITPSVYQGTLTIQPKALFCILEKK